MGLSKLEQYASAVSFLVVTGGGGVIAIWPDAKVVGYAMMVIGPVPLLWVLSRHILEWWRSRALSLSLCGSSASDLQWWSQIGPLTLLQAAWLWCEAPPQNDLDDDEADFAYEKLRRAIATGQLKPIWGQIDKWLFDLSQSARKEGDERLPDMSMIRPNMQISVSELRSFAEQDGTIPEFLRTVKAAVPELPSPQGTGSETRQ